MSATRGILPDQIVLVVNVQWFGSQALELTYKGPSGRVANELLYRHADQRTTRLYDRRDKKITRNIVERISI